MSQCPEMVDAFLQYGKCNDYDVVCLLAGLNLKEVTTNIEDGKITAVIHYKMPYTMSDKDASTLSFTIGNGISFRSVIGLPTLSDGYCY